MADTRGYRTPASVTWKAGRLTCCAGIYKQVVLPIPSGGISQDGNDFAPRTSRIFGMYFRDSTCSAVRKSTGQLLAKSNFSLIEEVSVTDNQYGRTIIDPENFWYPPGLPRLTDFTSSPGGFFPGSETGSYVFGGAGGTQFTPGDSLSITYLYPSYQQDISVIVNWSNPFTPQQMLDKAIAVFNAIVTDENSELDVDASPKVELYARCAGNISAINPTMFVNMRGGVVELIGGIAADPGAHRIVGRTYMSFINHNTGQVQVEQLVSRCNNLNVPCVGSVVLPTLLLTDFFSEADMSVINSAFRIYISESTIDENQSCPP